MDQAGITETSDVGARALDLFDRCYLMMHGGAVEAGMVLLHGALRDMRCALSPEEWRTLATGAFRAHPIAAMVREDPLTRRSCEKPRGYAGDAVLLDLIYRAECPTPVSDLGAAIFAYTSRSPGCHTVRYRRSVMARVIDEAAARTAAPAVISVACGHLREAQESAAFADGRIGRFVALDMDADSLALVSAEQPGVEPLHASVRDVIRGRVTLPAADLIYSAGLFDYLSVAEAQLLTKRLLGAVKPGGRLLVANLMPDLYDIGYMEACMDWWLQYRDAHGVAEFCASAGDGLVAACDVFTDPDNTVAFLQIERR